MVVRWRQPDFIKIVCVWPFGLEGLWLRYAALQNLIPSCPWIAPPSTLAQYKERKGQNFAIWQHWFPPQWSGSRGRRQENCYPPRAKNERKEERERLRWFRARARTLLAYTVQWNPLKILCQIMVLIHLIVQLFATSTLKFCIVKI